MNELFEGGNLDLLLEELHRKKRWLDTMIAGLEAALDSPQHQLIELAGDSLESAQGPQSDMKGDPQGELAKLADQVGAKRLRRRGRGRRGSAKEARG